MVTARISSDLAEWLESYARLRSGPDGAVSKTDVLEQALASFRADCEAGVPELRRRVRAQSSVWDRVRGRPEAGSCPRHPEGGGHIFSTEDLSTRPCVFGCGLNGRGPGGNFEAATGERSELFARLRAPQSVKGTSRAEGRG